MERNIMIKRIRIYFLFLGVLAGVLSGCSEQKGVTEIFLFEKKQPQKILEEGYSQEVLRIGVAAIISPRETFTYYQELFNYLSEKIGKQIILVQRRTYKEINDLLEEGKLEAAFICTDAYVELKEGGSVELLVVPVINGQAQYFSYIIVHRDSKIDSFEELRGKSFAFTDPLSNSGKLFPTYLLAKKNFTPQTYFYKTIFTHSHDNSIIAVAKGLVDGAAVDSLIWDYLALTRPELTSQAKIILKSPAFGIPPVVVPKGLDPDIKKKLYQIFTNLDKQTKGKEILKKIMIDKFIRGDDQMYDSIRSMRNLVKKIEY
ncbi:MAG: phosphate/phosphite/phosphonate ABC transporter substrate-binding protein [bacterium]